MAACGGTARQNALSRIVPVPPETEAMWLRLHLRDLSTLTLDDLWAEATMLAPALAHCLAGRRRDPVFMFRDEPIRESDWLRLRLDRLQAEMTARGAAA